MNHYAVGRRLEYLARDVLESWGYTVIRSAGSKGAFDLVAISAADVRLIQVKAAGQSVSAAARKMATLPCPPDVRREVWTRDRGAGGSCRCRKLGGEYDARIIRAERIENMQQNVVFSDLGGWLLSGQSANGIGAVFDCRHSQTASILEVRSVGNSAIFDLLYGANGNDWSTALTITALAGGAVVAQISAFYPFVAGGARSIYSAAGGSAQLSVYYKPGLA